MKTSLSQLVKIYEIMREKGVVLYGGGKEGALALHTLEREGIVVHAVADQQVGKCIGNRHAVSIEELCEFSGGMVCIVTPMQKLPYVITRLEEKFEIVIDNFIVHWMAYFIPQDIKELRYRKAFPFNHYESPFSQSIELEVFRRQKNMDTVLDIDLNVDIQLEFLSKLVIHSNDFKKRKNENRFRYRSDNTFFPDGDAVLLHSMIREWHPHRIIEIGSGFSTCVMLDTREYWEDCAEMKVICIEPYPERLKANVKDSDKIDIRNIFVQNVDLREFEVLEANDIVFIDSSHVIKTGGDILFEIFEILPKLQSGVLIHFHDIFYPFSYPENWVLEGIAYNEAYILRALLTNNNAYEIIFWNDFMAGKYGERMIENGLPKDMLGGGSSLWIRKL